MRAAKYFLFTFVLLCSLGGVRLTAQTFEVTPQSSGKKSQNPKPKGNAPKKKGEKGIGWGAGIETAREARAVDQALKKGDYKSAITAANRAANSAPQNAELWFLLGYAARLGGDYSLSLQGYEKGLQRNPNSIQGLSGEAQTYAKMGRTTEAQDLLKKVLAANPKSATDLQLSGELALQTDPKTALDLLKRADAVQATARTDLLIARAYQKMDQPDASKQYLDRAQSRAPNDPNVLRAVAAFYRDNGKYDESIATLQKAVAKNPQALAELAYTYGLAGRKKEAADTYNQAANKFPKDVDLQMSAAQAQVNVAAFEKAEEFLKRAEAGSPNSYRLHAIRGQMYTLEDHNDQAISEYKLALQNLPESVREGPLYPVGLHLSLSEIYRRTENSNESQSELTAAKASLDKVQTPDPQTRPEYLRLRALIEAGFNDPASAEKDFKEAMSLAPKSINIRLNYANLLWKTGREQEALEQYKASLQSDPTNHAALTAMGYLSRDLHDPASAEKYFLKLAELYPKDFVPHFALGDLYTANKQFDRAQASYEKAVELAPQHPMIYAAAINSSIEAHNLPGAKNWIDKAAQIAVVNDAPQVMRERQRYLTFTHDYQAAADLGYKVIEKLPHDPEAPVYLAYDLLYLNRLDDAYAIVQRFEREMPKDKDLPLVAGYVHAHKGQPKDAEADFTRSLQIEPNDATAYMNRGFVRNDLREASKGVADFESALKLRPNYGEAHLGLAFADLQLHRAKPAIHEADLAAGLMKDSAAIHLARAEGYRQQMLFRDAEREYRAALQLAPNDPRVYLALAEALYRLHRFADSLAVLKQGVTVAPEPSLLYAAMARDYAQLKDKQNAYQAIANAEKNGNDARVLMATGEALLIMGDEKAAMQRYARALDAPSSDRVEVRLALARLFVQSGRRTDAKDQVAYAMAESRVGEANAVTPENLIDAGRIFVSVNDYDLAKRYFERAQSEGADQEMVNLGLANTEIALGNTKQAESLLAVVGKNPDTAQDYDYLLAMGNLYQQEHESARALSMFARANQVMGGNDYAKETELRLAEHEGRQVTENVSAGPEFSLAPVLEDINIYQLDFRLRNLAPNSTFLPPRSSIETIGSAHYHLHFDGWPTISGLFAERNARGSISFPQGPVGTTTSPTCAVPSTCTVLVQYRNTYDTTFNSGINPVFHLFGTPVSVNPGVQFTIRRDSASPVQLNQDLFRQFVYLYTGSFANWVAVNGSIIHEAGPFTEENLHSREYAGTLEFQVGRPWGKTSFLTGYQGRDILFRPLIREFFTTTMYAGVERKFGSAWTVAGIGEYIRSWRVQDTDFAIAQALRPGYRVEWRPLASHWAVHAEGTWSRGEGLSLYDNVTNAVTVSWVKGFQRPMNDGIGEVPVTYPLRISFGVEQQSFYNFNGTNRNTILPIIRVNLF